jgi:transketolase
VSDTLHLSDFTSKSVPGKTIPRYYGDSLVALAGKRDDIVALSGDVSPPTESDVFKDAYPERFYNIGIAEANMVGIAAGMARGGDTPFVHSFSVFLSRRALDQIAMQCAYPSTNVKLVGFLPGLTTLLGVSHQAIDDIAIMRALPNMTIIEPCGAAQIAACVNAAANLDGPVYLRMHRPAAALQKDADLQTCTIGKGNVLRMGDDAVVFACGHMVDIAIEAANKLASQNIQLSVVNMHTIKPLDTALVISEAKRTGCVITAENHSIIGGLGSAVAETLLEAGIQTQFARVGIKDTFAEGGTTPFLFDKYGLSARHIESAVLSKLKR